MEAEKWKAFDEHADKSQVLAIMRDVVTKADEGLDGREWLFQTD